MRATNDRRSKRFCSNAVLCVGFTVTDVQVQMITGVIRLRSVHSIHSWWKSKRMLATYMRRMRNNNLEIKIVGSSCRPQYNTCGVWVVITVKSHFNERLFSVWYDHM